jgi:hypothetical protein
MNDTRPLQKVTTWRKRNNHLQLKGKIMVKKVAISLDETLISYIDRLADKELMTRSAFIKRAVLKSMSVDAVSYLHKEIKNKRIHDGQSK